MSVHHLWIDPSFGASGDMILGSLISLGAESSAITVQLASLGITGLAVSAENVQRCQLSCTRAVVSAPQADATHRPWSAIDGLIAAADLPPEVATGARSTFRRLAEVEARIHGTSIDEVHFHEVGAHDALADIVGAWVGWHLLGAPTVSVGAFGLGHGTVDAAHGQLPLPAPAVVDLLAGWPVRPLTIEMETVTPTGAALLTTMATHCDPAPPAGRIVATGRGAGGRDPDGYPNVVTVIALEPSVGAGLTTLMELTTNLDDVNAEVLAYTIERCLEEGAADAWTAPIGMKKGRAGHQLTVLCRPTEVETLRSLVLRETGSLGVRQRTVDRFAADRRFHTVEVLGHTIRIKTGPHGAKPEYDDCVLLARAVGLPLRQIQAAALDALQTDGGETGPIESL